MEHPGADHTRHAAVRHATQRDKQRGRNFRLHSNQRHGAARGNQHAHSGVHRDGLDELCFPADQHSQPRGQCRRGVERRRTDQSRVEFRFAQSCLRQQHDELHGDGQQSTRHPRDTVPFAEQRHGRGERNKCGFGNGERKHQAAAGHQHDHQCGDRPGRDHHEDLHDRRGAERRVRHSSRALAVHAHFQRPGRLERVEHRQQGLRVLENQRRRPCDQRDILDRRTVERSSDKNQQHRRRHRFGKHGHLLLAPLQNGAGLRHTGMHRRRCHAHGQRRTGRRHRQRLGLDDRQRLHHQRSFLRKLV